MVVVVVGVGGSSSLLAKCNLLWLAGLEAVERHWARCGVARPLGTARAALCYMETAASLVWIRPVPAACCTIPPAPAPYPWILLLLLNTGCSWQCADPETGSGAETNGVTAARLWASVPGW